MPYFVYFKTLIFNTLHYKLFNLLYNTQVADNYISCVWYICNTHIEI